jgi:hypothetical protein
MFHLSTEAHFQGIVKLLAGLIGSAAVVSELEEVL